MRLSTIMMVILMMDIFCFFGVQSADALINGSVTGVHQVGYDRPMGRLINITNNATLTTDANTTTWYSLTDWGASIGAAVLDATGLTNLAREISNAVQFFIAFVLAPYTLADLIGTDSIWFVAQAISLIYTFMIAMGIWAIIKGGSV